MRNTSPGAVYKDLLIMGASVSEGADAPPGYIQAFNIRTGKLAWVFHTIPLPGEYGYETWSPDSYEKLGGANGWSGITIDEKRGIAFVSTGSPSVDFYGGARKGQNLFANCVLALDAATGKRIAESCRPCIFSGAQPLSDEAGTSLECALFSGQCRDCTFRTGPGPQQHSSCA